MECNHARFLLELCPPGGGELEPADAAALSEHCAHCPDCAAIADAERQADAQIGKAMRNVPVPADLRERILKKVFVQRDVRNRRLFYRGLAVAAGLLLAVWLGQWGVYWLRPGINGELGNPGFYDPIAVQNHFKNRGIDMVAPPVGLTGKREGLDYDNLDSFGMVEFQGRLVPHLLFVYPGTADNLQPTIVHVYVLADRQFNLKKIDETNLQPDSGPQTVLKIKPKPPGKDLDRENGKEPDQRDAQIKNQYLFVVVFTGPRRFNWQQ